MHRETYAQILYFVVAVSWMGQAAAAPKPTVINAVSVGLSLDLSSFPNSTGPRRQPDHKTPAQYGFTKVALQDGEAVFSEPAGGWAISLKILRQGPGRILACFTDTAQNGGTYNAEQVLDLTLGQDGLYEAVERPGTTDCPAVP